MKCRDKQRVCWKKTDEETHSPNFCFLSCVLPTLFANMSLRVIPREIAESMAPGIGLDRLAANQNAWSQKCCRSMGHPGKVCHTTVSFWWE